jgi:hypothetical protein
MSHTASLPAENTYPLWAFGDSRRTVITRGQTQEQAFQYAQRHWHRGETITLYDYVPLWAKKEYDRNHSPGWLHRPMKWLSEKLNNAAEAGSC